MIDLDVDALLTLWDGKEQSEDGSDCERNYTYKQDE